MKNQPLAPALKHLPASTKKEIDQSSQAQLEKTYPFLKNLTGAADWDIIGNLRRNPAQREERSYALYRYFQLENAKPVSRFDPQFMEKRSAYINETGKDPLTGKEASPADKFTAQHYGWVKAIPSIVSWTDMIIGSYVGYQSYNGKSIYRVDTDFVGKVKSPSVDLKVQKIETPKPPYDREQVLKNIEDSRRAREASNFDQYLEKEKAWLDKQAVLNIETNTVWDKITPTQPELPGTSIPKSFNIRIGDKELWVAPNGTKHMYEFVGRDGLSNSSIDRLNGQLMLSEFSSSLEAAVTKNGLVTERMIYGGDWEFILSEPRNPGQNIVVKHARFNPNHP